MLDDIRWEFGSRRYLSLKQFVTEVSRVNDSAWPHDEIVMNNPKVAFKYSALISSLDELLPCENLAHADAVLRPDPTADGLFSVDIRAEIMATNRTSFSAGELLWIAHSLQANKRLGDHPRFAGFEIADEHSGVPAVTITTAA